MESKTYMERIGYRGPLRPSVEVLRKLHSRHMLSVPFENLDILLGRPIILSENAFYDKIIKHRRGGFRSEMPLATNIPKVPLQKGPPMHPLNSQWKIDPY